MIALSAHAEKEVIKRALDLDIVWNTLQNPDQILNAGDGILCYQSKFTGQASKAYLMRIFVNTQKEPNLVITLYKTSKIEKYWNKNP